MELWTASTEDALRIEFFGDQIDRLTRFDTLTGDTLSTVESNIIYPSKQFTTPVDKMKRATLNIRAELTDRIAQFNLQALDDLAFAALEIFGQTQQCRQARGPLAVARMEHMVVLLRRNVPFAMVAHQQRQQHNLTMAEPL